MQMHYPILLPDETLYNLAARYARLNGYCNHLSATRDLMGNAKATSIANCQVVYKKHTLENLNLYGDSQFILETLTTKLLRRHLGEPQLIDYSGKQGDEFLESVYGLNPTWRACQICAKQHLKLHGVKYWQRSHQLPTSIVCYRHGNALRESYLPRRRLHDHLWLPSEAPIKPKDKSNGLSDHWIMIARIGYNGLQDKTGPQEPAVIKSAMLMALRNKGLVTNQNKILLRKFNESFDEFFGAGFKHVLRSEVSIKAPIVLLKGITNELNANALHRIALVHWLFGSWDFFKQTCKWIEVFKYPDEEHSSNLINDNSDYEIYSLKARKACVAYMDGSINPTRNEFIKTHYREFNWLLRHDREWLGFMMPIYKSWIQIEIFG